MILIDNSRKIDDSFEKIFWSNRCVFLWQSVLLEPVLYLKNLFADLVRVFSKNFFFYKFLKVRYIVLNSFIWIFSK